MDRTRGTRHPRLVVDFRAIVPSISRLFGLTRPAPAAVAELRTSGASTQQWRHNAPVREARRDAPLPRLLAFLGVRTDPAVAGAGPVRTDV